MAGSVASDVQPMNTGLTLLTMSSRLSYVEAIPEDSHAPV